MLDTLQSILSVLFVFSIVMLIIGRKDINTPLCFLPVQKRRKQLMFIYWVIIAFCLISVSAIMNTPSQKLKYEINLARIDSISASENSIKKEQDRIKKEEQNDKDLIYYAEIFSRMAIEQNLKCPSTAHTHKLGNPIKIDNYYICNGYVDAENSYGAHIRSKYSVKMIYNGGEGSNENNWTFKILELN